MDHNEFEINVETFQQHSDAVIREVVRHARDSHALMSYLTSEYERTDNLCIQAADDRRWSDATMWRWCREHVARQLVTAVRHNI